MPDLEARVVRTIGDPDIRFREDPIRILRAVKFAARCDLTIEPETYRRMMEHRQEIAKCAQARVSEEFYRLLRAGAAKRSMELLLETELLDILAPEMARGLKGEPDGRGRGAAARAASGATWPRSIDRPRVRPVPPSNALLLAVLVLPPLRDALDPGQQRRARRRTAGRAVDRAGARSAAPVAPRQRDGAPDPARAAAASSRRRARPEAPAASHSRDFFDEALRLAEIVSDAEGADAEPGGTADHRRGSTRR